MSKFRITVDLSGQEKKRIVDVNETPNTITGLTDVDQTNQQDKYLLVWNSTLNRHEYIPASQVNDLSDAIQDDVLDYGTY
jgi:hypothetical protein